MVRTLFPPKLGALPARAAILAAIRCWRRGRDERRPVLPDMFAALAVHRCGAFAPVLNSLLTTFESCVGRRFTVGRSGQAGLSRDEDRLLDLLAATDDGDGLLPEEAGTPGLAGVFGIALRSARIMLRQALEPNEPAPPWPVMRLVVTA